MTDYELTRRDAIAALTASGIAVAGVGALTWASTPDALDDHDLATLQAVARAVYPDDVDGVDAFVERVIAGRTEERPAHAEGIADAVSALDERTRHWHDARYVDLAADEQADELSQWGLHTVDPDPQGEKKQRARYFLVNELLYALYTSPTGGELVGIENPQGHPGGTGSYQRPPVDREPDERDGT